MRMWKDVLFNLIAAASRFRVCRFVREYVNRLQADSVLGLENNRVLVICARYNVTGQDPSNTYYDVYLSTKANLTHLYDEPVNTLQLRARLIEFIC